MTRLGAGVAVLVIVMAATALVVSGLNVAAIASAWRAASWQWIVGAAAVNLLSAVVDALRWRAILAGVRRVSMASAIEALLLGWLANAVLPLKLGEGARAWALAGRERLPVSTVLSTVVLDRVVDAALFVVLLVVTSVVAPLPSSAGRVRTFAAIGLAVAMLILLIARRWGVVGIRARPGIHATVKRVTDGLAVLGHQHRLAGVLTIAAAAWCIRVVVVWCAIRAFHLLLPVAAAATVLVTVNLGIAAIAAPANLGVFEMSVAAGLALWQVPGEIALSVGIGLHAAELVPVLAWALVARGIGNLSSRRHAANSGS